MILVSSLKIISSILHFNHTAFELGADHIYARLQSKNSSLTLWFDDKLLADRATK